MPFDVQIREEAERDLDSFRAFEQNRILDTIEDQLTYQPNLKTRNRKQMVGLTPRFEHNPPLWELRIGDVRVFYDVDVPAKIVHVRAIRRKLPHQTTDQIV